MVSPRPGATDNIRGATRVMRASPPVNAIQWNWSLAGTHELDDEAGAADLTGSVMTSQPGGGGLPATRAAAHSALLSNLIIGAGDALLAATAGLATGLAGARFKRSYIF